MRERIAREHRINFSRVRVPADAPERSHAQLFRGFSWVYMRFHATFTDSAWVWANRAAGHFNVGASIRATAQIETLKNLIGSYATFMHFDIECCERARYYAALSLREGTDDTRERLRIQVTSVCYFKISLSHAEKGDLRSRK